MGSVGYFLVVAVMPGGPGAAQRPTTHTLGIEPLFSVPVGTNPF